MSQQGDQESLEVELIRSLFEARGHAAIMSTGFIAAGCLAAWRTHDPILTIVLAGGVVAALLRLAIVALSRREAMRPELTIARARVLQRRFTLSYFGFAAMLGMFGYRAMTLPYPKVHVLTICMLVGYGAGVAAGIGLRPRIAIPSMLVAIVPALNAALTQGDALYWATSALASAYLVAGIESVRWRHARASSSIGRRLAFSTLALRDGLTALPNRLALREWFAERITFAESPGVVAVHYLDLDGFKPVNDRYGHAVGDALLIAVGQRIARTIRASDTAARMGGDEFAIVQCGLAGPEEADLLAQRLASAIARPFRVEAHTVSIATCVGYVVAEHGAEDLECLLSLADEALYASKRRGGGVTRWTPELDTLPRAAA